MAWDSDSDSEYIIIFYIRQKDLQNMWYLNICLQ